MPIRLPEISEKWQRAWRQARIFEASPDNRPKFFITVAYPYVSGPMHLGHARTYLVPDVIARYKRMRGYNVLFPFAYHFTGTPIVGVSKRVKSRDPPTLQALKRFGVPEEEIEKFEDPVYFAQYWAKSSELGYRRGTEMLGLSIDWRREFTTVDSHYQKFITWQYHKLQQRGLIVKGRHPVKWCPSCNNPVTDHDLLEGEGVEILEFTLIKYRQGDLCFPAATLRPETIFGLTNIWLNPKASYVVARVDGEKWVVSREGAKKLKHQGYNVEILSDFTPEFGSEVSVPITNKRVPILPAEFVDPNSATGVVGSVPAHAPYDYIALKDLERDEKWKELASKLKPIPLIELEGYGECPAVTVVERMKIKDQLDPKLEEATKEVYKEEFARGRMKEWTGKYAGMPVSRAREEVKGDLICSGDGAIMYEFSYLPVTCRCGSSCIVKVVEDQWFIDYSNPNWKEQARSALSQMELVPPESRAQYEFTINWLHEWPCTRKIGLGTPAPWAPDWIIESLSDSTIYMAFYTISHLIKQIEPEKLDDPVFDFIFAGQGDPAQLEKERGIQPGLLTRMRQEFDYWYPLDFRVSAYELISNHLTFFIFHHSLLFPHKLPRGILALGMVMLEGRKMSTSKGWLVTIPEVVRKYGADGVRFYLLLGSEPWQDFNWRESEARATVGNINRFLSAVERLLQGGEPAPVDRWLMSRLQGHIRKVTQSMERFETRKSLQTAFFEILKDVERYFERGGKAAVGRRFLETWLRLLSPFIPHLCEELWSRLGKKGFICTQSWPEPSPEMEDSELEVMEEYLDRLLQDLTEVVRVTKRKPARVYIYTASQLKVDLFKELVEGREFGEALQHAVRAGLDEREASEVLGKINKLRKQLGPDTSKRLASVRTPELKYLKENLAYIEKKIGGRVEVWDEKDPQKYDPQGKASRALPFKPAIYLE